jgi:hypothetical protein
MLGVPLVPCHEFPTDARAAFLSVHALKDPGLVGKLSRLVSAGTPVLLTDGLAKQLAGKLDLDGPNVRVLPVQGDPKRLLELSQVEPDALRAPLLRPFGRRLEAPNGVAVYLYADVSAVLENFNDRPATVRLDGAAQNLAARGWVLRWQ